MSSSQSFDARNLSSRKLWELVRTGKLPRAQQQMVEQELLLRRNHLESLGSLHPASSSLRDLRR